MAEFFLYRGMRIAHFSDSHLGAGENHPRRGASGLTLRQEDIINSFIEAVDKIIALKPDVCIHSGDIFHVVRPLNKIIALAADQLYRIAEENKIPTIIIAGNHDAPKQPHIGAAIEIFKHIPNLYVVAESKLERYVINDTEFFALPHCMTSKVLKEELDKCRPNPEIKHNVLILHGVASGMPQFSMADLGEQEIPVDLMDLFDYTALGHFHDYCQVAPKAYYSGSTERLSQSERHCAKGFAIVELEPFQIEFHEVATRPMIDLKTISASGLRGDQLAQVIKEQVEMHDSSDKIIRVKVSDLTDETLKTIPADLLTELKRKSYSLNISFEKEETTTPQFGRSAIGQLDKSFIQYLDQADLSGFKKDKLIEEALKYLSEE